MDQLSVREILDSVYRGQIRIPAFQRGFVWEPDRVAFLIDSIYKGYPFGSLLFWRTTEQLRTEKNLGPFELPEPQADFPIDYVLDGQQRITSIFGVFQTELGEVNDDSWKEIYFDYSQDEDVQETQFFALEPEEVDITKHFPLRAIFNTAEYRRLTRDLDDVLAEKIDSMQAVFKEASIPVQSFRTEQKEKVAIIFERINRQGVPLDTLQLLSAWTWSEEFQLTEQFEELIDELQDYGFSENDVSLLLRCSAAVLTNSAKAEALVGLNGATVRGRFSEVLNGIKGALDFLQRELKIEKIDNLPFQVVLAPLSVFFSAPGSSEINYTSEQRASLLEWFWRVTFSKRYSAGTIRNLNADIEEIIKLKRGEESRLTSIPVSISSDLFTKNKFLISSVNTKALVLMLAQCNPRNFVNGSPTSLSEPLKKYNRKEFHHLMPKAFLQNSTQERQYHENALANFCFISRADNRQLGGAAPSAYRAHMTGDKEAILQSHLCPNSLFDDHYDTFIEMRASNLLEKAHSLCNLT